MVLCSLSPVFLLWAIRGTSLIPDIYFISLCILLGVAPYLVLFLRIRRAKNNNDVHPLEAGRTEDLRSHVLVYLFAILLPFYREDLASCRDLAAMVVAFGFIIFLFWRLNLHYMNLIFSIFRYQVFMFHPTETKNPLDGHESYVLITRRRYLLPGQEFYAYRLSNTVYLEKGK